MRRARIQARFAKRSRRGPERHAGDIGAIVGVPKLILHLEGAALALSAAFFFWRGKMGQLGADRALGYGLKYATAFGDTHLDTLAAKSG